MTIARSHVEQMIAELQKYVDSRVVQAEAKDAVEINQFGSGEIRVPSHEYRREFPILEHPGDINQYISTYKKNNNDSLHETPNAQNNPEPLYIRHEDKYYTCLNNNSELTLARAKNALVTIKLLKTALASNNSDNIKHDKIQSILDIGGQFNDGLDVLYKKTHNTYLQRNSMELNIASLMSIPFTLWRAIHPSSHATKAFQHCRKIFETMTVYPGNRPI